MTPIVRRLVGIVFAIAVTLSIAALSRVPYAAADADGALIRFSWRTHGAQVEECRRPSQEESDRLPVHMRRDEICERRIVPYRLVVLVNGRTVYDELVRPSGAREDRPLYVFRELPVTPGDYQVEVLWQREDARVTEIGAAGPAVPPGMQADRHTQGPTQQVQGTTGTGRLQLTAALQLNAGDVTLITYDLDRQVLVARGRGVAAAVR